MQAQLPLWNVFKKRKVGGHVSIFFAVKYEELGVTFILAKKNVCEVRVRCEETDGEVG
jgi:hypothetical protein